MVWTELRGLSPVIEGMRSYVIGALQDITDRKIAGNALRESEKRFKTLFERSAEAQLLIDDTGKITDCNAALLTLFALKDKEEILGHSPEDFAPEFQPDGIRSSSRGDEIFSRVMEEGMVQYEWAHRKHDAIRTPVMTEVICTLITIAGQPMIHASIRDITDRKTAQDSLREREATLASIFRAAPTGIGMVVNRVIMKVNDRLCDMTGYQAEELLGKSARVLYASDEDYEYVGREKYEQIRKSGTGTVETRWQRKDGTICNVLLSSTPIDPADHSKGVTFTALDITDRKRQERIQKEQMELGLALQKAHGLTETLETCLASAIRVSDMDAGAIYLADPVTGSFNLAVAQNLSSAFASSVSHFPADSVNARMVMAGKPVYVPFGAAGILHTPAQEREGLRAAAFFPITSGGRVAASLNVASRILNEVPDTARLAIETIATQIGAALERIRSEEALHLKDRAIASSINAIVISDMDGRITYVNDAFTRLWGYTAQESLGMPVTRLGRSDEEVEKFLARFRTQGYAIGESIAKRKDGSPFVIQVSGSLVADETGQPQAMLSSFVDITGRRQAEESLRRAYEQITTFEEELRSQFNELAATQEELQKQQQQLAEVANMVPGVVYQFYARPDGTRGLYYVSSRASDIFGFPDDTDDFYSWFTAHVDPRDRDAFLRSNDDVIASVSPWDFEGRFIRPSGEEIWFQGMSRPIRRGSELVFNGVLLDITDRKQAELAIRENEQKYRTLVETTGTGYVIVDERGNVLDANPEYVRLTGHTGLAEIAGRNVLEWTAEYEREKNAQAVQQCVRDGFIRNYEIDYTGAAGTITPIEINATVMESGGSVRILTLCRDISERKKSQDALKASETKFRTVVETAEEGIWIVSRDYLTLFTNRKMQELFGYPMEEMAGRPVWDFVSPEEVGSMKQQLSGRPRGISGRYEQRWIRKDGTAFWCLTSSTPLFSSDGTFV